MLLSDMVSSLSKVTPVLALAELTRLDASALADRSILASWLER